jgi:C1A family cysteine protease
MAFQLYSGGILSSGCGTNLDHGVLAVGYGDGYFKVKNSWGASWGENGYLQISDSGNTCGIHSDASYPTVSASAAVEDAPRQYAKGFVRMPRNAAVPVDTISDEDRAAAPAKLDYTTTGATSPVKDQGQCGSCWAFSATQGIESAVFQATGNMPILSTQQIISCDKTDGGCAGGDLPTAFDYVESDGGIDSAESYPDTSHRSGSAGSCKSHSHVAKVTDYKYAVPPCQGGKCNSQDEDGLKASLAKNGPLSICVNAESWNGYNGGVYKKSCSGAYNKLDHCVQLVGYDTTASTPYWIVKNSWGTSWGEDGHIWLKMGENACGIADEAMYVKAEMASAVV